jgi:hypothetical protein
VERGKIRNLSLFTCQILMRLAYEVKVWLWAQGILGVAFNAKPSLGFIDPSQATQIPSFTCTFELRYCTRKNSMSR